MEYKGEEEDYWNVSANRSFNFDDDDTSVPEFASKSDRTLFIDDNVSESSYEGPQTDIPMHLLLSDQNLRMILEEQSMHELPIPKNITLEEEVKLLRRLVHDKNNAPSVSQTMSKILLGKSCSLEMYKSLHEKEELLDAAIASGNGDAILYVILFLVRTLKRKFFHRIMLTRPYAVNQYINYLVTRLQITECTDLLVMLGRHNEAAMFQFYVIVQNTTNADVKRQKLKKIYSDYFSQPGSNMFYSQLLANYINLLEFQHSEKQFGHPNSNNIIDKPVLETLYYACTKYKWNDSLTSSSSSSTSTAGNTIIDSPFKLIELHQINSAQFEWIALNERCQSQAWRDLELLFEKKNWLNLKQKSFNINIPLDKAILQLHSLSAPVAVLNSFLSHVDDAQNKLLLARKVGAVRSIVDALVILKDRSELEYIKEKLGTGSEERFYAENALKNLNSKWKT